MRLIALQVLLPKDGYCGTKGLGTLQLEEICLWWHIPVGNGFSTDGFKVGRLHMKPPHQDIISMNFNVSKAHLLTYLPVKSLLPSALHFKYS